MDFVTHFPWTSQGHDAVWVIVDQLTKSVAYRLALPSSLSGVHEVFHVSILWKYTPNVTHVVD